MKELLSWQLISTFFYLVECFDSTWHWNVVNAYQVVFTRPSIAKKKKQSLSERKAFQFQPPFCCCCVENCKIVHFCLRTLRKLHPSALDNAVDFFYRRLVSHERLPWSPCALAGVGRTERGVWYSQFDIPFLAFHSWAENLW